MPSTRQARLGPREGEAYGTAGCAYYGAVTVQRNVPTTAPSRHIGVCPPWRILHLHLIHSAFLLGGTKDGNLYVFDLERKIVRKSTPGKKAHAPLNRLFPLERVMNF